MTVTSLDQAKALVRQRCLALSGVHGVGLRRKDSAVCLYVHGRPDAATEAVLERTRGEIHPFVLEVIYEQPPMMA